MRIIRFLFTALLTIALIFVLNKKWGSIPAMGKFLSPQFGIWQNAEPTDENFSLTEKLNGINGRVEVILDERLVPHIFADADADACFVQGYLHAKFRLWQMEFQTYAAAGRISEIIGERAINFDKNKRRLGMVYAAEKLEKEIMANPL